MFINPVSPRSRIIGTGSYAPVRVVENAELEQQSSDAKRGWIEEKTGIVRRRVAATGEVTSDLAMAASRRAIEASGLTVANLNLIILATSTGDSPLPATAAHLQQKLGADLIPAFDVNAGSAGFLYALAIADQFIAAGVYKTVLVAAADLMSRVVAPNDRVGRALFGDGAGAVIVAPATDDARGILSSRIHADGTLAELMHVPGGGSAEPLTAAGLEAGRQYVSFDGRELFNISVKHVSTYSMQALKAARLTSAELDWVVPQQANVHVIRRISERLGFPMSKFVLNLSEYGNTLAASVPLALDEGTRDGRILPGQTVLLCALGPGVAWGATMLRV